MVSRGLGIEELANLHSPVATWHWPITLVHACLCMLSFENLHGGANIREFVDWFPGATIEQIHAVLKLETNILLEFASQQARS